MKSGLLRIKYKLIGLNFDYLITYLHNKHINIYKIEYKPNNMLFITIDYCDKNKFFAICKNMCYNAKVVNYYGVLSILAKATNNIGLIIGLVLFCIIAFIYNNLIFSIQFEGSGAVYKDSILEICDSYGIKKYTNYKSVNFEALQNDILKSNKRISFVSVKKRGNKLIINSILNDEQASNIIENEQDIICEYDGVIESASILRGTLNKSVGESVFKNDVLVYAHNLDKDGNQLKTYILGRVTILSTIEKTFTYSYIDDEVINNAIQIAKFDIDLEVVNTSYKIENNNITILLTIRYTYFRG